MRQSPKNGFFQLQQGLGSGVAVIDFDLDGRCDFYLGQQSGIPPDQPGKLPNVLFRQHESSSFIPVQKLAGVDDHGYTMSVTAGDLNQDGFKDLVVGNFGANCCFLNQGDGTFKIDDSINFANDSFTTGLAVADVSGDRVPDLIQVNYLDDPAVREPVVVRSADYKKELPDPLQFRPGQDCVWVASPTGLSYEQVKLGDSSASNETPFEAGTGLGLLVSDLDPKPGLEIFVANDMRPNHFWVRSSKPDEQASFHDLAKLMGCAVNSKGVANACMGVAFADFNRDGLSDLFVTNFYAEWVNLFVRQNGGYRDVAAKYQLDLVSDEQVGFGCQPIDFDNNGLLDLVVANGHIDDLTYKGYLFQMHTQLLVNRWGRFTVADQQRGYWGKKHLGRCVVSCDFNRDGLTDVGITDLKDPFALLQNQTETNGGWIQLRIAGNE